MLKSKIISEGELTTFIDDIDDFNCQLECLLRKCLEKLDNNECSRDEFIYYKKVMFLVIPHLLEEVTAILKTRATNAFGEKFMNRLLELNVLLKIMHLLFATRKSGPDESEIAVVGEILGCMFQIRRLSQRILVDTSASETLSEYVCNIDNHALMIMHSIYKEKDLAAEMTTFLEVPCFRRYYERFNVGSISFSFLG